MNDIKQFKSILKQGISRNTDVLLGCEFLEKLLNIINENERLQDKVYKLEDIIKEVREYITYWHYRNDFRINSFTTGVKEELLEILDKVGNDNERDKDNK